VLTVVLSVPIVIAVAHQATALLLFGVWLAWLHHVRGGRTSDVFPVARPGSVGRT
jgi:heme A synthase